MTEPLVGASYSDQELYRFLVEHVARERELLEEYEEVSRKSTSAAFRYLARLLVSDEISHHLRFEELAAALRAETELEPSELPVPRLGHWGDNPGALLELTERFLKQEEEDARELRHLSKRLEDVRDSTLWQLLVRMMQADTDKHVMMLSFVRDHVRETLKH